MRPIVEYIAHPIVQIGEEAVQKLTQWIAHRKKGHGCSPLALFPYLTLQLRPTIKNKESNMKFISANLESLKQLYVDQLEHLHSAETQLMKALPKMIEKATDSQL